MYQFQSPFRVLHIEGLKEVRFENGLFSTDSEAIAKKLRGKKDVNEITGVVEQATKEAIAEAEPKRKFGTKVVRGARTSEVHEENQ